MVKHDLPGKTEEGPLEQLEKAPTAQEGSGSSALCLNSLAEGVSECSFVDLWGFAVERGGPSRGALGPEPGLV